MSANRLKLNADKTELLWTGSRHSLRRLSGNGSSLVLGSDDIDAVSVARLLGVWITPDLCIGKRISTVSRTCFCLLRQLQRVRRSLDIESASTLVHAFVTSCVDYCNVLLAGAPKIWMDKLQRILNAAARVVTRTRKYNRGLTRIRREDLHLGTTSSPSYKAVHI